MVFKDYIKKEFSVLMGSFRFDNRFWKMLALEIVLILLMLAGFWVFAAQMEQLTPLIQKLGQPSSDFTIMGSMTMYNTEEIVDELKTKMTLYMVSMALYAVLIWSLFKCLIYTNLLKKKITKVLYGKFIVAQLIWGLLIAAVYVIINKTFYATLFYKIPYSIGAQLTLFFGILFGIIISSYFTVTFFITFTQAGEFKKGLKDYWDVPLKKIKYFILPAVFTFLVFIVLNIIMRFFNMLPERISLLLTGAVSLSFIVWLKIYYKACIENVESRGKAVPVVAHKVNHEVNRETKHDVKHKVKPKAKQVSASSKKK